MLITQLPPTSPPLLLRCSWDALGGFQEKLHEIPTLTVYTLGVWIKCTYTLGVNIRLLSAGYRLFLMFFISFTSIVGGEVFMFLFVGLVYLFYM